MSASDFLFAPEGYVGAAGEFDSDLGAERELEDFDPASTTTLRGKRSAARKKAKWVKNDSGATLSRGMCVKYKAAYFGLRVGDHADVGDICDGAVDDMVSSAGVLDGENFWLVLEGPNLLIVQMPLHSRSTGPERVIAGGVLPALGEAVLDHNVVVDKATPSLLPRRQMVA